MSIKEHVITTLRSLEVEGYLGRPHGDTSKNRTYDCPFHGLGKQQDTPSFAVRVDTGQFNCFNPECSGKGPNIYVLYSKLTGVPLWQVKEMLGQIVIPIDALDDVIKGLRPSAGGPLGLRLQKPWPQTIPVTDSPEATRYLTGRGIPQNIWEKAGIKFYRGEYLPEPEDVSPKVKGNRIIFPIYYWDQLLVGYSSRSLIPDDVLKYYRPVDNIGKWFYNPFMVGPEMSDSIVLCEGEVDVLAFLREDIPAWGCFGSSFSNEQADAVSAFKTVYFAFDIDTAGIAGMKKAVKRFEGKTSKLRFVKFPKKDAAEMPIGFGKDFQTWVSDIIPEPAGVASQDFLEMLE